MDWATILGLMVGLLVLATAVGSDLAMLWDGTSLLVVVGGGLAATLIAFPLSSVLRLLLAVRRTVYTQPSRPTALIEQMVDFSEIARREGILALEGATEEDDDPFVVEGIRLAVDGTEPALIKSILETEVQFLEARHRQGQRLLKTLGTNLALFGVLGMFLALLREPNAGLSGVQLAVRLTLPLFYGGLLSGFIVFPIAQKLTERTEEELLKKKIVAQGVDCIQAGDNPRLVEHRLMVFLSPKTRSQNLYWESQKPSRHRWWWWKGVNKKRDVTKSHVARDASAEEEDDIAVEEDDIVVEEKS